MILGQATNSRLILCLVLAFFSLHAALFALTLPVFQGPDEPVHYATVQKWAQRVAPPSNEELKPLQNPDDIRSYRFSDEVTAAALITRFDEIKWQPTNTLPLDLPSLRQASDGQLEQINPPHTGVPAQSGVSGTWSWYYWFGAQIENRLVDADFFTRFFSVRLLSVVLGLTVVVSAWHYFAIARFSPSARRLMTLIVAAQPMLLATSAIVNIDIALITAFSIFAFGSTYLLVRGFSWPVLMLTIGASFLAITAKGPGVVLILLLLPLLFLAVPRTAWPRWLTWRGGLPSFLIAGALGWLIVTSAYFADITRLTQASMFPSPFVSLGNYIEKTLDPDRLMATHASYWGNFGWLDTPLPDVVLELLLAIELIALLGLIAYFLSAERPDYLPSRRAVAWALCMMLSLQLAIRFFDWRVFDGTGELLIGTPGRYFLPTLIPAMLVLATGLGWLTRNRAQFHALLKWLATGAICLALVSYWYTLIPRYYF